MDIGHRYLAAHLFDAYYCPEDQATGCRECSNERECWQEVHEAGLCWKLDEECVICQEEEDERIKD